MVNQKGICAEGDKIGNGKDCNRYRECEGGSWIEKTCTTDIEIPLYFDVTSKTCKETDYKCTDGIVNF